MPIRPLIYSICVPYLLKILHVIIKNIKRNKSNHFLSLDAENE